MNKRGIRLQTLSCVTGAETNISAAAGDRVNPGVRLRYPIFIETQKKTKQCQTKKGGTTMNAMKKLVAGVLGIGMLALGLTVKAEAYADSIMADNTAQITITIRPNINRSVTITTDNVNMDLGLVDLTGVYVATQTVTPATVTISGTYGNTDLLLSANITGGWTFDASSNTIEQDKLATWVTFSTPA